MTKQEHVIKILEEKGYKPSIDKDGDVMVRYQMKYIFVQIQDPDDLYYRVFMPNIYPMDGGEEQLVLAVCNKMTREAKCMKAFLADTYKNVCATFEFYSTEEALQMVLEKAFHTICKASKMFNDEMAEVKSLKDG